MKFLDPTIDIAFKRLFGNNAKPEIVISFLNNILELPPEAQICSVVITDPHNQPDTLWLKKSVVDVRCTDQQGRNFIIEIQVENQKDYTERSQYYASLAVARQLEIGDGYTKVMPVIFIGILNFNLFDDPDYLSRHLILNTKTYKQELKHLSFAFIELPKFTKTIDQLESVADKWIYLIKHAAKMDSVPTQLQAPSAIGSALDLLNQGSMSRNELAIYDDLVDSRRVEESIRRTLIETSKKAGLEEGLKEGLKEGMEAGMEKGIEKGIEKGMEAGIEKGSKERALTIAKRLSTTMTAAEIATITGLSVDEINNL